MVSLIKPKRSANTLHMPPKLPNLRFKPKLVAKNKQPNPQDSNREELTLLQLERLQQQEQKKVQHSDGVGQEGVPGASPQDHAASHSRNDPSSSSANTARPTTATGHAEPISSHSERGIIGKEALYRNTGIASYPDRAETFEADTVYSILTPPSDAFDRVICPIPLQPRESTSSSCIKEPSKLSQALKHENEEEEQASPSPPLPSMALDGTAFLREGDEELARARRANLRFFHEFLSKKASLDVKIEDEEEYRMEGDPTGKEEESPLVYMQIPRFFENPPFVLSNLPPGKVGELKVFKNGRMVMDIAGVYYDVCTEGGEEGAHSTVAITQPPSDPLDENCKPSCFEVGSLAMKMVCTPAVEED